MIKIANNLQKLMIKVSNSNLAQSTPTAGGSMIGSAIAGATSSVNANNNSNNALSGLNSGPKTTLPTDKLRLRPTQFGPGSADYAAELLTQAGGAVSGYNYVRNKMKEKTDDLLGKLDESTAD